MREKRRNVDFSKHELKITENEHVLTHNLKIPDTITNSIKFINTQGIMAVTGDFGNWIFCREFHPSPDGYVSDHYWCEKLRIASSQEPMEYDSEGTQKEIEEAIEERKFELKDEESEDISKEELDIKYEEDDYLQYYNELLDYCDCGEWEYETHAYGDGMPDSMDHECVPNNKKIKVWLQIIFDGFEEICDRLKQMEDTNKK